MIKKLRQRFIIIAMLSIGLVLLLIIGSINIANYISINNSINSKLSLIAENGGTFPEFDDEYLKKLPRNKNDGSDDFVPTEMPEGMEPGSEIDGMSSSEMGKGEFSEDSDMTTSRIISDKLDMSGISAESPYDTRYFTVTIKENGSVYTQDTGNIQAVSRVQAQEYALTLFEKGRTSGTIDCYRYRAVDTTTSSGEAATLYIFVDYERELDTFYNFLLASGGISLVGLLLVFILVFFFSKLVVRPIAESYAKQKRFITDASHEIKTPLTIIDANTEVIEMMEGENEWTESIRKQIKRLTSLTEKLVLLSRMDEESTTLIMNDFDLSDAVFDTADPFTAVASTKGKKLTLEIAEGIHYTGDEKNIRQLVSLLVDNAIKYSSENGEIKVTLATQGKNKILTVWNTVNEIKPGSHNELFERFYRLDSSRNSKTGGFGIGLSVVYAIVTAHKGSVTAKSEDGKSIEFIVTL